MEIAALASAMKYSGIKQQASISVLKMTMEQAKLQADDLAKILEQAAKAMELSVNPNLGGNVDIRV
ncbi:MAG: YjfB family protein [Lutispora sp.]|nr:YjfB family protein [Lutispora sp.]